MLHNRKTKEPVINNKKDKNKSKIIKIWNCDRCQSAHFEKPVFCRGCGNLIFNLIYTGQVAGSDELLELIKYGNEITRQNHTE
jgi:hypothetical protein